MRKGRWCAVDMGTRGGSYRWMVEDDDHRINTNAHCICCAYSEALAKHGGDVDLRGLYVHGPCYQFLAVMVAGERRAKKRGETGP